MPLEITLGIGRKIYKNGIYEEKDKSQDRKW